MAIDKIEIKEVNDCQLGDSDLSRLKGLGVRSLGDNPSADGLSAETIKKALYRQPELIFGWIKSIASSLKKVADGANNSLSQIIAKAGIGISYSIDGAGNHIITLNNDKGDIISSITLNVDSEVSEGSDRLVNGKALSTFKDSVDKSHESIEKAIKDGLSKKLDADSPTINQMAQGEGAVTNVEFVSNAIKKAVEEAEQEHIEDVSVSNVGVGTYKLTITRKDAKPLETIWKTSDSTIIDTSNPPFVDEEKKLHINFVGGSKVSVDMTELVDTYKGSVGDDITIEVDEFNNIKASLSTGWVKFLNDSYDNERVRVSNENQRIINEANRQKAYKDSIDELTERFEQDFERFKDNITKELMDKVNKLPTMSEAEVEAIDI